MVFFVVLMTASGVFLEKGAPYVTLLGVVVPAFGAGYAWASAAGVGTRLVAIGLGLATLAFQLAGQALIYEFFSVHWVALLPPMAAATSFALAHFFGQPDEAS